MCYKIYSFLDAQREVVVLHNPEQNDALLRARDDALIASKHRSRPNSSGSSRGIKSAGFSSQGKMRLLQNLSQMRKEDRMRFFQEYYSDDAVAAGYIPADQEERDEFGRKINTRPLPAREVIPVSAPPTQQDSPQEKRSVMTAYYRPQPPRDYVISSLIDGSAAADTGTAEGRRIRPLSATPTMRIERKEAIKTVSNSPDAKNR